MGRKVQEMSVSLYLSILLFVLVGEPVQCLRWKTIDAVIQDGWPDERATVKLKRASSSSSARQQLLSIKDNQSTEDDEESLIFEGRYFKPDEVPPPPKFMVGNNWRGSSAPPSSTEAKPPVGSGKLSPPLPIKFTLENVKTFPEGEGIQNNDSKVNMTQLVEKEKITTSNSKSVFVSSVFPLEDVANLSEDQSVFHKIFKDAPKCFTASDTQGRCVLFKHCFPVVFNVIDGNLRNPGLAKLLYQSSGPCNASLELDFVLSKLPDKKTFHRAEFYNQTICCPGFKHPPVLRNSWANEVRSARLVNDSLLADVVDKGDTAKSFKTSTVANNHSYQQHTFSQATPNHEIIDDSLNIPRIPVEIDESSVELEHSNNDSIEDVDDSDENEDIAEEQEDVDVRENVKSEPQTIIVFQNDTRISAVSLESEERREKFDFHKSKRPQDASSLVPEVGLAPTKCRQQLYGMPRGHWPWMAAIVISSRHICSGAIVDELHVVTAAHCVYLLNEDDVKKIRIILGDRVMYSSVDGPHFWRKINKITTHLNFNQATFASDIAILRMNSPVPFSRNIQAISIPLPESIPAFRKGIVAGWSGADIGQAAFEQRTEAETVVDVMDKAECREVYRGFALSGLAANTFCTKPGNNTCVADSGAPLFVRKQNCWQLVGIMSWALGCSHFPEVYTDVSKYVTWIRKHTS